MSTDKHDVVMLNRDRVLELTRQGCSVRDIADILHISTRSVNRIRARNDCRLREVAPPLTPDECARAKQFLVDGASYPEVARTLGRSEQALRSNFPGYAWTLQQASAHGVLMRRVAKPLGLT